MLVGVGLYAYYSQEPPTDAPAEFLAAPAHPDFPNLRGEALELYEGPPGRDTRDRIFPIFILEKIPKGLKGLIVAAIFAAAISSLMGILTALSQVVMSAFYNPLRERYLRSRGIAVSLSGSTEELAEKGEPTAEDRRSVLVGRLMVLFWGIVLCLMAYLAAEVRQHYKSILDLGLAMVGYTGGALLAGFALSFLPLKIDGRGFMYSGPLSAVCVFAMVWHQPWTHVVCWVFAVALLVVWIWQLMSEAMTVAELPDDSERHRRALALVIRDWPQTLILVVGLALMMWLNYYGYWEVPDDQGNLAVRTIAWPWYAPFGSSVAFIWGYLLARRRSEAV
jgi:Na+/proline symporter